MYRETNARACLYFVFPSDRHRIHGWLRRLTRTRGRIARRQSTNNPNILRAPATTARRTHPVAGTVDKRFVSCARLKQRSFPHPLARGSAISRAPLSVDPPFTPTKGNAETISVRPSRRVKFGFIAPGNRSSWFSFHTAERTRNEND